MSKSVALYKIHASIAKKIMIFFVFYVICCGCQLYHFGPDIFNVSVNFGPISEKQNNKTKKSLSISTPTPSLFSPLSFFYNKAYHIYFQRAASEL